MALDSFKSHVAGHDCYGLNLTDYLDMPNNFQLQQIFNTNATLTFQFDEFSENETLMKKGTTDLTTPNLGQFFIVNNAGFLEIYLAEINGLNWLCYRSTNQIVRTKRRKLITLRYTKASNLIELFVDSTPEPIALKTGGNLRTLASDFTGINTANTDNLIYGRGDLTGFPDSLATIYYDHYKPALLTQQEINTIYQTWQDTRILPSAGRVIFASDRLGSGYDIWEMNADGTDPILLKGGVGDLTNPKYSKSPITNPDYVFQQGTTQILFDSPNNGFVPKLNPSLDGGLSADSSILYAVKRENGYTNSGYLYTNTLGVMFYPLTYAPYSASAPNIYYLDPHPTTNNNIIVVFYHLTDGVFTVAEVALNFASLVSSTVSILYQTSYTQAANTQASIFNVKYNKVGDRIGFNAYINTGYTNLHGYLLDTTGANLVDLGLGIEFVTFSPDGVSVLLQKTVIKTIAGVPTNVTQLFTRNLNTNAEVDISNNLWNDIQGDWKA